MAKISVDAVVFDFDGVLVESVAVKGEAFAALYEDAGADIQTQILDYHYAHGGVSRYAKIRHFEEALLGRSVTQAQVDALAGRFSDIVEERVVSSQSVKGALEFLQNYHVTIPLFVVSATPEEELIRIVEKRGMRHFFKAVYGSPRSKAENLKRVLEQYRFTPARTVMIGDTMSDHKGAAETGTRFLGRVAPGDQNPFPAGTPIMTDLARLQDFLDL